MKVLTFRKGTKKKDSPQQDALSSPCRSSTPASPRHWASFVKTPLCSDDKGLTFPKVFSQIPQPTLGSRSPVNHTVQDSKVGARSELVAWGLYPSEAKTRSRSGLVLCHPRGAFPPGWTQKQHDELRSCFKVQCCTSESSEAGDHVYEERRTIDSQMAVASAFTAPPPHRITFASWDAWTELRRQTRCHLPFAS